MRFEMHLPTEIVFGRGRLKELGERTAGLGDRVLLVSGQHAMHRHGVLARAVASFKAAGLQVTLADNASPDPRSDEVDEAVRRARKDACNVVVGLGGGSAIDAAKAAAVSLRHGEVGPLVGLTLP